VKHEQQQRYVVLSLLLFVVLCCGPRQRASRARQLFKECEYQQRNPDISLLIFVRPPSQANIRQDAGESPRSDSSQNAAFWLKYEQQQRSRDISLLLFVFLDESGNIGKLLATPSPQAPAATPPLLAQIAYALRPLLGRSPCATFGPDAAVCYSRATPAHLTRFCHATLGAAV
jgi:hypothetical protein